MAGLSGVMVPVSPVLTADTSSRHVESCRVEAQTCFVLPEGCRFGQLLSASQLKA